MILLSIMWHASSLCEVLHDFLWNDWFVAIHQTCDVPCHGFLTSSDFETWFFQQLETTKRRDAQILDEFRPLQTLMVFIHAFVLTKIQTILKRDPTKRTSVHQAHHCFCWMNHLYYIYIYVYIYICSRFRVSVVVVVVVVVVAVAVVVVVVVVVVVGSRKVVGSSIQLVFPCFTLAIAEQGTSNKDQESEWSTCFALGDSYDDSTVHPRPSFFSVPHYNSDEDPLCVPRDKLFWRRVYLTQKN